MPPLLFPKSNLLRRVSVLYYFIFVRATFSGSLFRRLLKTGRPLAGLTCGDMQAAARFACCAASLSTQAPGGMSSVPPEGDVLALAARTYP